MDVLWLAMKASFLSNGLQIVLGSMVAIPLYYFFSWKREPKRGWLSDIIIIAVSALTDFPIGKADKNSPESNFGEFFY